METLYIRMLGEFSLQYGENTISDNKADIKVEYTKQQPNQNYPKIGGFWNKKAPESFSDALKLFIGSFPVLSAEPPPDAAAQRVPDASEPDRHSGASARAKMS